MRLLGALVALFLLGAPLLAPAAEIASANCLNTHILKPNLKNHGSITNEDSKITLRLETAATPEAREKGLMHRKTLAPCDGMVFFFPSISSDPVSKFIDPEFTPQKFWMKNTLIPLDILFVDEAGKIISIITATPLSLEPVGPDAPVATVIEIAGGRAAKEGIVVGDRVQYELAIWPWSLAR